MSFTDTVLFYLAIIMASASLMAIAFSLASLFLMAKDKVYEFMHK